MVRRSGRGMRRAVAASRAKRLALLGAVGRSEFAKRGKAEIEVRNWIRQHRGPGAGLSCAAVDPCRRDAHPVRWRMVVEQALCDVEEVALADAVGVQAGEQILEIANVGLVRTDVLRRENMIEFNAELAIASGKAQPVDVGQDDQLEVLLEIAKCLDAVGKGRPVANRRPKLRPFDRVRYDAEPLAEARMHLLDQL